MSQHPSTPMSEGDVGLHLRKQTKRNFQNIDLLEFNSAERLQLAYQNTSTGDFIVFDTVENRHLRQIAKLLVDNQPEKTQLLIGSSGISFGLGQIYGQQDRLSPKGQSADQILVVSAVVHPSQKLKYVHL